MITDEAQKKTVYAVMKRKVLTLTIMLVTSIGCHAFYPIVKNFSKKNYSGGPQNWSITQSNDGSMWFANSAIMEYDGNSWERYYTSNRTSIRSVFNDEKSGRLYFGATDEFGYMHIKENRQMSPVSLIDSLNVSVGDVWAIHKIGNTLWIRGNNCMFSYDNQEVKQYSFNGKIAASSVIGEKLIVFVNNHGVYGYSSGEFKKMSGTDAVNRLRVCSILDLKEKGILFVTASDGLFLYSNNSITPFVCSLTQKTSRLNIYCAATNGIYISLGCVGDGVFISNMDGEEVIHINTSSGLQNNTVLSMFYDNRGDLWLGLDKGISLVELSSAEYRMFGNDNRFGAGYASAEYDGRLYLGTNQGLYSVDISSGYKHISDDRFVAHSGIMGQVWSMMTYDGNLFCCHDKGITVIGRTDTYHIPLNGTWKLEELRRHKDMLLGSTYDRMFVIRKSEGRWRFHDWIKGFEEASKVIEEDKDGHLWFGHWIKGLYRLKLDLDNCTVTSSEFMSRQQGFPEDWGNTPVEVNGEIIFHTADGYFHYDGFNGKAYPHEQLNSMFVTRPAFTHIYMSEAGDLYFSSGSFQGYGYRNSEGRHTVDSLSLKHMTSKRIIGFEDIRSLDEKTLLLNTEDGFSVIRTDILKETQNREEVRNKLFIKSIHAINGDRDTLLFSSRCESTSMSSVRIPYRLNSLKFKVALPAFGSSNTPQYSYMLENYDKSWSGYSDVSTKEYTQLPHGDYVMRIRSRLTNIDCIFESQIKIHIEAPWYLGRLAVICYMILGILILYLVGKCIMLYSERKIMELETAKEEEMKKRQMAADLEHKAQDLAASTMNLIRKNEILLQIDSELEKATDYLSEDRNRSLKIMGKIRKSIHENIQHDDSWQKFEKNFDIVYNDYLKNLSERFPNLTMADKKMCAYLKMGLSSKEIAPLLNITVRSVEMSRYRLRKKLNLDHENLTTFLQNL